VRVLVTGGAGFIGSHLCDALLTRGDEVWVVDDLSRGLASRLADAVTLHVENVLNASELSAFVSKIEPKLIFHLAAQVDVRVSVASPAGDAQVNVVGTVNVLEAARLVGARVILGSTGGAIYGDDAPVPSSENTPPAPGSPYGVAKYCAEQYIRLYNHLFGTEHAILRFANVYGPRQGTSGESGVISISCANGLQGKPLTVYGNGRQTRDFLYVKDCALALLAAANRGKAGLWNIGTGIEVDVLELALLVAKLTDRGSELVFAPARLGELTRSALDWERAAHDLGWRPTTSLADGVLAVINSLEAEKLEWALK
jgi:UDP-glucose 4-epimerase